MPKISAIIPTYNNAEFLQEAIESVLAQTYKDIEIIVVDDGSTDNTEDVVKNYAGKLTYIRQENAGPAKARNTGILQAKGEYIAFLDADDSWLPNKTEEQLKVLEDNPNSALVYSKAIFFDSDTGNEVRISPEEVYSGSVFDTLLSKTGPIVLSSVIARSGILYEIGMFEESLFAVEDIHLWLKIAKTHEITGIDKALVKRRLHSKNISLSSNIRNIILDCLDNIVALFPDTDPKIYEPMRKAYMVHGEQLVKTLFYYGHYKRCHAVCGKVLAISIAHPTMLLYWLVTTLPYPLLQTVRQLKKR